MAVELDLDPLVEEVNLYLNRHQKIHKDDPILANVLINKVILDKYVKSLHDTLQKSHHEISAATGVEMNAAKELAGKMIDKTAGHLEAQLQKVGEAWEEKFRLSAQQELAKVQEATRWAQIGGAVILMAGGLTLGMCLANFFFLGKPH
jgi:hypothetical protein